MSTKDTGIFVILAAVNIMLVTLAAVIHQPVIAWIGVAFMLTGFAYLLVRSLH